MPIYKTIAKIAALLAILGLVLSSFALMAGAQSPVALERASTCASFNRDLTAGSSGADVTALQNWLIGKGIAIPAGATGYFGQQTRGALARYQAQVGISPAAGYFGPITRAKVSADCGKSQDEDNDDDSDSDNDEDNDDEDELEVVVEIRNGKAYVEAEVNGEEESFVLSTTNESRIITRIADRLDVSEEAVEDVIEFIEEDEEDEEDDDNNVETSATVTHTNGADSDSATFVIAFDLSAFNQDAYIARDPDVSFEYEIQDGDGNVVGSQTYVAENLESTADTQGSYYVIEEDDEERFTFTVVFDPLAADEGEFFRLQLTGVDFNDTAAAPDQTWTPSPRSDFRTRAVNIAD